MICYFKLKVAGHIGLLLLVVYNKIHEIYRIQGVFIGTLRLFPYELGFVTRLGIIKLL
jgi:hypothetical protein